MISLLVRNHFNLFIQANLSIIESSAQVMKLFMNALMNAMNDNDIMKKDVIKLLFPKSNHHKLSIYTSQIRASKIIQSQLLACFLKSTKENFKKYSAMAACWSKKY